jgi:hypothetical protein
MSDVSTDGAERAGAQSPITEIVTGGSEPLSLTQAARALGAARKDKDSQEPEQRQAATPDPAEESTAPGNTSGDAEDAGEHDAPPGETEHADRQGTSREDGRERPDPQQDGRERPDSLEDGLAPIEPPRSWTKADKDLFTSLPRETQLRIAERERSREGDFSRRQQEAAEKLKGLTAKEQQVEQVRTHYESALPVLLQQLQDAQGQEFSDIRSIADVERLSRENWPRYAQWDFTQKKIALVQQQMQEAQLRQHTERHRKFAEFAKREDDLLTEKAPEMTDPKKAAELQGKAVAALKAIGFDDAELGQAWNGHKELSLRDHRVQLLIRDATQWREAQAKARTAAAKPVPPVQRPGSAQPRGAAAEQRIQNLNKQLENASGVNSLRVAAKLVAARRAAR